jgi:MFS family permease
MKVVVKPPPLR